MAATSGWEVNGALYIYRPSAGHWVPDWESSTLTDAILNEITNYQEEQEIKGTLLENVGTGIVAEYNDFWDAVNAARFLFDRQTTYDKIRSTYLVNEITDDGIEQVFEAGGEPWTDNPYFLPIVEENRNGIDYIIEYNHTESGFVELWPHDYKNGLCYTFKEKVLFSDREEELSFYPVYNQIDEDEFEIVGFSEYETKPYIG